MTVSEAKKLQYGDILHYRTCIHMVGPRGGIKETSIKYRVNGKVKIWKRPAIFCCVDPDRVQVPIKHGLYDYAYLDNFNLDLFHRETECIPYVIK
jgi:hypothetical protein